MIGRKLITFDSWLPRQVSFIIQQKYLNEVNHKSCYYVYDEMLELYSTLLKYVNSLF